MNERTGYADRGRITVDPVESDTLQDPNGWRGMHVDDLILADQKCSIQFNTVVGF